MHVREAFEGAQHLGLVVDEVTHDDIRIAHLAEVRERRGNPCDAARDGGRGVEAPVAVRQDGPRDPVRIGVVGADVDVAPDGDGCGGPAVAGTRLAVRVA